MRQPTATVFVPEHAIGGQKDLPIPFGLALGGAVAALVVSFCVLALAWRRPRYEDPGRGRPVPAGLATLVDSSAFAWALRVLGLVFFGYATWALVWGKDLATNPVLGVFYVLVWVGLVPASLLFGPVVKALSPVRTLSLLLARATGGDPAAGMLRYPERLGLWPAAGGLLAFVWQELVDPQAGYLGTLRLWLAVYLAVVLLGATVFGEVWCERADPFEVYSNLVARLSPWGRYDGRLVLRAPLANLARTPALPGLVAVVGVLFGSTAFDSYKESLQWNGFVNRTGVDPILVNTVALLVFCAVVALSFTAASMSTGVETGVDARVQARVEGGRSGTVPRRALPRLLAHSVVPIVVGYITAHYLSYFVEMGQTTLIQLSDPLGRGDNYLGTGNWSVSYWLSFHPALLATLKVLAVIAGHVVGVVAAHDRAIALLPARHHVTGQLGMLVIMVAYTVTGLYLLMGAS